MSDVLFPYDGVILDACVIINLYASGHMLSILKSIPKPISIAAYVYEMEAQRIYSDPDDDVAMETESINLQPFVESDFHHVVRLENGSEAAAAVSLSAATRLDTGEAISAAIAVHRSWSLATDDKAAISFFARQMPQLQLISTLQLLKHWVDLTRPHGTVTRLVVEICENEQGMSRITTILSTNGGKGAERARFNSMPGRFHDHRLSEEELIVHDRSIFLP